MIQYGIFNENGEVVREFESMEAGLAALRDMKDGEVVPYAGGEEGYYTERYSLERGMYSRVCHGKTELGFREGAPVEPVSAEKLGLILSYEPCDELETLLETLDVDKARELYDSLEVSPIEWNKEARTMVVPFYYLETEDTPDGDMALFYKCAPFVLEN